MSKATSGSKAHMFLLALKGTQKSLAKFKEKTVDDQNKSKHLPDNAWLLDVEHWSFPAQNDDSELVQEKTCLKISTKKVEKVHAFLATFKSFKSISFDLHLSFSHFSQKLLVIKAMDRNPFASKFSVTACNEMMLLTALFFRLLQGPLFYCLHQYSGSNSKVDLPLFYQRRNVLCSEEKEFCAPSIEKGLRNW